jgi:hypothetical protein
LGLSDNAHHFFKKKIKKIKEKHPATEQEKKKKGLSLLGV